MLLFTNLNCLFRRCFKFNSLISRCFIASPKHFYRTSASLSEVYKPFGITRTFESTPETIRIEFQDSLSVDFYYIWLRNSCNCEKCVHPKSKQRLLDTSSLSLNIIPRFCHVTSNGNLKVVWPEGNNEHTSIYDPLWLHKYGLGFERNLYEVVHDWLPPTECWTAKDLHENLPEIEYREVMEHQRGINMWLQNMHKYGIVILKNTPCETGEVIDVMNRITHIKHTRWGSSFHITTDQSRHPSYLPYMVKNFHIHTDMDYLEKSPGIQVMHCLETKFKNSNCENENDSGKFVFVDGFNAANWVKENYPIYFDILSSVPVKFKLFTESRVYANYQPIVTLNRCRNVTEIHCNNRTMAPLEGPASAILNFFVAYKLFVECVNRPENQFKIRLQPGDMIAFNNRRILNGRKSFDSNLYSIHLEGCYADMDDTIARYRAFVIKKTVNL